MNVRPRRHLCVLLLAVLFASAVPSLGLAQDPSPAAQRRAEKKKQRAEKRRKQRDARRRSEASAPKPEPKSAPRGTGSEKGPLPSARDAAEALAREAAQGVDAEIVKEGDTSVKVMQFSGLDIEGRLKSPQLLYFVNRVRAEFDRPRLPHRSFMPEVERAAEAEPLR